ncbi:MAG: VCBS repeat-containing protein, partial [Victivallales bacterium]|nr:VCBS repeat-containing protein [Victivallales bacterium]
VLVHDFIEAEVYSMTVGDGNYVPKMTATTIFSCADNPNGWKQLMMGSWGRYWPGGFDYTVNGLDMDNPLWKVNLYVQGCEADPTRAEALIDLSGFENTRLWQCDMHMGFGAETGVCGRIVQTDFRDAAGNLIRSVPQDVVVQAYSRSYPSFTVSLPTLRETEGPLPPLFPHTGSIQFGDINGDGLLDAVSSVRQNNGIEEGVMTEAGYRAFVEFRHSVWLRQADGSWQESLFELGNDPAELILLDLDGDGVTDLAASDGRKTYFFKNDGEGNFTKLASLEHRNGEYEASGVPGYFTAADFDNDGKPDFLLLNDAQTQIIHQESPTQYTVYPVGFQKFRSLPSFARGMAVGDVNGDGWMDFVISGENTYDSTIHLLYINNGGLRFTPYRMPSPNSSFTSFAIADADQDGCDDILICGLSDSVRILFGRPNDAKGNVQLPVPAPMAPDIQRSWGGNAVWADVDMDGRLEAVMSGPQTDGPSNNYDIYGESTIDTYPLHEMGRNYLKVLSWDGEKYVDSHIALPGTAGFFGPSLMSIVDFDGDNRPDIVHGGCFCNRSEAFVRQGPSRRVTGMKYVHNEVDATNAAPSAPTNLSAKDMKNGKAVFSWADATDAETSADGLRYYLRIGTASGKDDVIPAGNTFARRSGVTLTNLPAKKLYWAVRTVDATGNLSPWSAEAAVTPSGTTPKPTALTLENLPEVIELPEFDLDVVYHHCCTSADENQGTAYGSYFGSEKVGSLISLHATPNPGYRFAYWEGDVLEPLSHASCAYYHGTEKFVAHFMPDTSFLQTSAEATGFRDSIGNLWLWGKYNNVNGEVVQDTPPQFAAAAYTLYFALADGTAYYGAVGPGDASDYYGNSKYGEYHWSRTVGSNHVLRAVNGSLTNDKENVEHAWGGTGGLAILRAGRSLIIDGGAGLTKQSIGVIDGEDIIEVAVQNGFILLLTSCGAVKGIGDNAHCQIGADAPFTFTQYTEIKGLPLVTAIAAGATFGAALDTEGNVWTWGNNRKGQLGRGTVGASYPTPAKIAGLTTKITAIAAGDNHLVALDANGVLHAWGDNANGQLGA